GNYKVKTKRAGSSSEEPAIFIFGYIFYRTLIKMYKTAIFTFILAISSFALTLDQVRNDLKKVPLRRIPLKWKFEQP
ncbi:hypothetical protein, partial [Hallerella porci]|uniref:hypothetical protein n=1 Tax=Hallerella porci TaxID=1945871 RepID=UPI001E5ADAED